MPRKSASNIAQERVGIRLSSHEKLCAERMDQLRLSIDKLEKKIDRLSSDVSRGKGIVAVLVFLGSISAALIGYLNLK
tara:strand:+ start:53 stop:286 length:234 start_codon:yes stop_codon:yes gene_type:complete